MVKKVPDGKQLLTQADVQVNGKKNGSDEVLAQLYQKPNTTLMSYPLWLNLYNLSKDNPIEKYEKWLDKKSGRRKLFVDVLSEKQVERLGYSFIVSGYSNLLKSVGEAPVIYDKERTEKSLEKLNNFFFNQGYFNVHTSYKVDSVGVKKNKVTYLVDTKEPYMIDNIKVNISSEVLDSLYRTEQSKTKIIAGKQFDKADLDAERTRITQHFRNRGAYYFQQNYINYVIDTTRARHKADVEMIILNQNVRTDDSIYTKPFNLYKISEINIFTTNPYDKNNEKIIDSLNYKGINIYSYGKLRFKPKALTDPLFLNLDAPYADFRDQLTRNYISNLNMFGYPSIQYIEDKSDPEGNSLMVNIRLNSLKRYRFSPSVDVTHSNIQDFGIEANASLSIRNIFRGAEMLQIALKGNVGSSRKLANPDQVFFNISEYGADLKLTLPRIWAPFNTEKIIPRQSIPSTLITFGMSKQENIGLDKQNLTGVITYNWRPFKVTNSGMYIKTFKTDVINLQYVRNTNASNYFNVYTSSYNRLNSIASQYGTSPEYIDANGNLTPITGTAGFIDEVLSGQSSIPPNSPDYNAVRSIEERRQRLTDNNLIQSSSFTYQLTNKVRVTDYSFFNLKAKVEVAGYLFSLFSVFKDEKNERGKYEFFGVEYSDYLKFEAEYIKHWELKVDNILAFRFFGGIAKPYGNSTNIPFSRSYFAGGSNDIRGWQAYKLGPGKSDAQNDYNEANMKLTANVEYRFPLMGKLHSALFVDVGNIWNVFDDTYEEDYKFKGIESLKDVAVATGVGFRYNFGFVVFRIDLGFKTYNPANKSQKWFKYNLSESVLNIGINYPF
ncbi:MAG: BamA/TamA family outer membrane protein [Bacteroidota bacterium]|nr:BamA/TamA family outer membrane protein [Bacteroidota bacterium]